MKKLFLLWIFVAYSAGSAMQAQSLWTSAEADMKIVKGLNAFVEGEYRTQDGMSATERWAGTVGLDYKLLTFLKMTTGYSYIHQQKETEITKKGNIIPSYWQPRHRAFWGLTGTCKWNQLSFSLRERYQYTYRKGQYVPKFDEDGITPKDDEWVKEKHKHVLRSRMEVEYNIKKCKFTPFASFEIYHSLSDGFDSEKMKWSLGTSYKINKKHALEVCYRYIDEDDDDESNGHVISIGYKFKL